mmetsp:Transcript_3535/g.6124  ORF Transcript_3535/g.6124 Transcript_3535/m.6124 type:complete len:214 (+) Transcript_3535:794-1435(+)
MLEQDVRVPQFVREHLGHGAGPVPVNDKHDGKDRLEEGPGEEEQVARDGDPNYALHLTFRRYLVDRAEGFEDGAEPMAEDGDFANADDGHGRQQEGIDENHPLRRIDLREEKGRIQNFHQHQTSHQRQERHHGLGPPSTRIEVLFQYVGPVHQNENEDAEQTERTGRQEHFRHKGTDPAGVFGVKGHEGDGSVRGLEHRVGDQEPDRPKDRRH